ncbi:hypothetical protein GQ53DRAFT_458164 [Thozetella sp. PMI_491]|nr:hypothetical protein GQ53DRAFT_458164 [Thozetella sp. PMI_491]
MSDLSLRSRISGWLALVVSARLVGMEMMLTLRSEIQSGRFGLPKYTSMPLLRRTHLCVTPTNSVPWPSFGNDWAVGEHLDAHSALLPPRICLREEAIGRDEASVDAQCVSLGGIKYGSKAEVCVAVDLLLLRVVWNSYQRPVMPLLRSDTLRELYRSKGTNEVDVAAKARMEYALWAPLGRESSASVWQC